MTPTITSILRTESDLRAAVAAALRASGLPVEENVVCAAGAADLTTLNRSVIIECKLRLTRAALHQAIGQVLLYRQCLNPHARAVIIGYAVPETESLIPIIEALGIQVVIWTDRIGTIPEHLQAHSPPRRARTTHPPVHLAPQQTLSLDLPTPLPSLHWNIAALAEARGMPTVAALANHVGIARQGLYRMWNDLAAQISLEQLARLASGLDADLGDWFVWGDGTRGAGDRRQGAGGGNVLVLPETRPPSPARRSLHWNLAAQATARGLDLRRFGYRAELQPVSAQALWDGTARAVAVATLGRVVGALDLPDHPFSIGTLFCWRREIRDGL